MSELKVGNVITCSDFQFGRRKREEKGVIGVGVHDGYGRRPNAKDTEEVFLSPKERALIAAQTGKDPGEYKEVGIFDAFCKSRGKAKFVVIEVSDHSSYDGGSHGGSASTTEIKAKRLKSNGKYDPKGEIIFFNWNFDGHYDYTVENLKVVGNMKMSFA